MANIKITELNAASSLAATDVVPVVDVSADETKKITATDLFRTLPDGTAAAPSLSFASDSGNGVFLAGTDTVGISTGGTQRVTVDGSGNVTISGDLQVDGATTTVQSTTVTIDDKNIELGSVATPTDTTADGGGITLKGATDKEIKWVNSTGYWTFNTGIEVGGHLQIDDNNEIKIGTGQDLKIYHDGGNSAIQNTTGDLYVYGGDNEIYIRAVNGEDGIIVKPNGEVELFHNGIQKFETKSDGIDVTGEVQCDSLDVDGVVDITGNVTLHANLDLQDNDILRIGTGDDLKLFHDGSNSYIADAGTGNLSIQSDGGEIQLAKGGTFEHMVRAIVDGAVTLYYDGVGKIATKSDGIDVVGEVQCDSLDVDGAVNFDGSSVTYDSTNGLKLADSVQLRLGAGNDLRIYHDGSNSIIRNTTGHLKARANTFHINNSDDNESMALFTANGAVELFYDNAKKFETKSDGIDVTGEVQCDSLDVDGGIIDIDTANDSPLDMNVTDSGPNYVSLRRAGTRVAYYGFGGSGNNFEITNETSDGQLVFFTNSLSRARIDSSGRFLLGTTTEGHSNGDDITVASSATTGITIRSGTSSSGNLYFSDGTSGDDEYRGYINYDHGNDRLNIGTNATARLSINSNGAWGIEGTSNYGTSGQVLTSNGNDSPTWQDAASGSTDSISEGNTNVECVDTGSDGHILFDTEGSEAMRIDSSGNVGIGHNSPASLLTIGGDAITSAKPTVSIAPSSGNGSLTLRGGAATLSFDITGGNDGTIIYDNSSDLLFKNGTLDSSTERMRMLAGGGLTFNGDTAAANALDDYEEGTWTPHLYVGSTQQTLDVSYGIYRKIGSLVFIKCHVSPSSVSGSGAVQIRNLPFTQASGGLNQTAVAIQWSGTLGEYGIYANIWRTNDVVQFARSNAGGNTGSLEGTDIAANSNFGIAGCYEV